MVGPVVGIAARLILVVAGGILVLRDRMLLGLPLAVLVLADVALPGVTLLGVAPAGFVAPVLLLAAALLPEPAAAPIRLRDDRCRIVGRPGIGRARVIAGERRVHQVGAAGERDRPEDGQGKPAE